MKKTDLTKLFLLIFIVAFAGFCFAPCIVIEFVRTINFKDLIEPTVQIVGYEAFAPIFCCSVSAIEIVMMMFKNNNLRLVGFAVNLIKTFATYPAIKFVLKAFETIGGLGETRYSLSVFGYITILIGCIISVLYILTFIERHIKNERIKYNAEGDYTNG